MKRSLIITLDPILFLPKLFLKKEFHPLNKSQTSSFIPLHPTWQTITYHLFSLFGVIIFLSFSFFSLKTMKYTHYPLPKNPLLLPHLSPLTQKSSSKKNMQTKKYKSSSLSSLAKYTYFALFKFRRRKITIFQKTQDTYFIILSRKKKYCFWYLLVSELFILTFVYFSFYIYVCNNN